MPRGIYPRKPGTSYNSKHLRVRKARGLARDYPCELRCGRMAREWSMIHGSDGMDPKDYRPLCKPCHQTYDISLETREKISKAKTGSKRPDTAQRNRDSRGWRQTPETRLRIAEGMRRYRQSQRSTDE